LTSKVTTEVLEKGTRQTKTIFQMPQKHKSKIYYNKKAESEFFVDNSALAGFTGERIL
jgi:DNA topoisomerase-6 subunit B